MIYCKQIPPEYQDSLLFDDEGMGPVVRRLIWLYGHLMNLSEYHNIRRCNCVYSFADLAFTGSNNS